MNRRRFLSALGAGPAAALASLPFVGGLFKESAARKPTRSASMLVIDDPCKGRPAWSEYYYLLGPSDRLFVNAMATLVGAENAVPFRGYQPGTVMVTGLSVENGLALSALHVVVEYEIGRTSIGRRRLDFVGWLESHTERPLFWPKDGSPCRASSDM